MDVTSPLLPETNKSRNKELDQEYDALAGLPAGKPSKSKGKNKNASINPGARLPRNVPRKVIGEIRRKGDKSKLEATSSKLYQRRLGVHAFSYEISLRTLHRNILVKTRRNTYTEMPAHRRTGSRNQVGESDQDSSYHSITFRSYSLDQQKDNENVGRLENDTYEQIPRTKSSLDFAAFNVNSEGWECEAFFDVLHVSKPKPTKLKIASRWKDGEEYIRQFSDSETEIDADNASIAKKKAPVYHQLSDPDHEADDEEENPPPQPKPIEERLDVFLFGFGSVVFWNFDNEEQEVHFMDSLTPFLVRQFKDEDLYDNANDAMDFVYSFKPSVKHDLVRLGSREPEEKLAVSYALAQSNLLSVYEWRLDKIIDRNEHIPQELAETGKMSLTQDQISREVGLLFMERNSINLASDVLDTPVFFWENDEWDPVYSMLCKYLEHENRIDVLNRRLDCVHELLEVLQTQAENQHASRLEWIIIWLITCEVVIQVLWNMIIKDILGFFNGSSDD